MDQGERNEMLRLDSQKKPFVSVDNNNEKTKLHRIWSAFPSYCTLHGLHFVFEGRPTLQRLIWGLLLLSMLALFIWQTSTLVVLYFQFRVTSTVQLLNGRESIFPAVSICNFNRYRNSTIHPNFLKLVKEQNPLDGNGTNRPKSNWTQYADLMDVSMEDLMYKAGHQLKYNETDKSGMLYRCDWKGVLCSADNFTTSLTDLGICYTFNSAGNLSTTSPGNDFGLKLRMSVEQGDYNAHDGFSAGLRIRVHDQGEPPLVSSLGFAVMPGSHVFAALKRQRIVSLKSPYETMCQDQDLYGISSYTIAGCHDTCKEKFLTDRCNCRSYSMRDRMHPLCNVKQYFECIVPWEDKFSRMSLDMCNCTEPCDILVYKPYLSYGSFPSNRASDAYSNGSSEKSKDFNGTNTTRKAAVTRNFYRENLVQIDIFYEDLYYNVIRQVPAFNLQSLLGEIGGLLGLFLGASTLTVVEFLDLGIIAALARLGLYNPVDLAGRRFPK